MIIDSNADHGCHGLVANGRVLSRIVAMGGIGLVATGCLGSTRVADPFTGQALSHAAVVSDTVDCDMGPESCSRYIVLRPMGISRQALLDQVSRYAMTTVGWTIEGPASGAGSPFGQNYLGSTDADGNDYGGYISSAQAEYAAWQREHFTRGINPPIQAELAAQRAMRQTPNGVFIQINGSTCGSVDHCQGGR